MGILRSDNQGGYNPVTKGMSHGNTIVVNKDIVVSSVWLSVALSTSASFTLFPRIYDQSGTLVTSGNGIVSSLTQGWKELPVTPVRLSAGKKYIITYYVAVPNAYNMYANMLGASGVFNGDTDGVVATVQDSFPLYALGDGMPSLQEIENCPPWALGVSYQLANHAPNPPKHVHISSEGATYNGKPNFYFDVSDPDGDQITNVQLQVANTADFSTGLTNNENMLGEAGYGNKSGDWAWLGFPASSGGRIIFTPPAGYGHYAPGVYYMRARVKDSHGAWSDWSATQSFRVKAVPWSDTLSGGPGFKAQWLNEIYACIQDYRRFRGWGTANAMDGTLDATKTIKAFHIMERRKYLSDIMASFSASQPVWSTPELTNLFSTQQSNGGMEWGSTEHFSWYYNGPITSAAYDYTDSANPEGGWGCVKLVNNGSTFLSIFTAAHPAQAKPNTQYTSGVWVKGTAGKAGRLYGFYRDATNTRTGSTPHVSFTFDGTWQFVKNTFQTQANTAYLEIEIACINGTGTEVLKWGGGFLVQGNPFALDRNNQHILELRNYITKA